VSPPAARSSSVCAVSLPQRDARNAKSMSIESAATIGAIAS
jgi:hypothetical protein